MKKCFRDFFLKGDSKVKIYIYGLIEKIWSCLIQKKYAKTACPDKCINSAKSDKRLIRCQLKDNH